MTALTVNKRSRKPKGQIRMEYPETLATISTQDTGRRQANQKTQHRKLKRLATQTSPKTAGVKCRLNKYI
jgi:hypothetical protein